MLNKEHEENGVNHINNTHVYIYDDGENKKQNVHIKTFLRFKML